MRATLYVCLAVSLFTGAHGYGQFSAVGSSSELRGRLVEGDYESYDGLIVEINNVRDRTIRERADVEADGSFAFRSVADGDYQVRVLTIHGIEVTDLLATIGQSSTSLEIRLPGKKLDRPGSGTVSMQQLVHSPSKQIQKLLDSGQKFIARQDYGDAAARFREAAKDDPDCVQAHADLGLALSKMEDWEAAAAEYRAAIALDPKSSLLHGNLGVALASTRRFAEAEAEAATAIKLDPQNARAHFLMAGTLLRTHGQLSDVVSHLTAAQEKVPSARESIQKICAANHVVGCP